MGVWGVAIFSDDLAADVRDDYRDNIGDRMSGPEATDAVLASHREELADPEAEPVVWLALAAVQFRLGRLEDRVRDRALELIDRGTDLGRWADQPAAQRRREAVLARLRGELTGQQRRPRRVSRPVRSVWPWEPGSVVAFRREDDRCLLVRVVTTVGEHGVGGGRYGVVEVLDWIGDLPLEPEEAATLAAARAVDWSAIDGHPRLHGISVMNQSELDRFQPVIERRDPHPARQGGTQHFLIGASQLEELAARRFGLG